jgi:hypothetical protein
LLYVLFSARAEYSLPLFLYWCHDSEEGIEAPGQLKLERHARSRQGPVLAVLTMLAAKMRLRVVPRGYALPLTAALRGAPYACRPGQKNGALTEQKNCNLRCD